jgi:hypothetical protein
LSSTLEEAAARAGNHRWFESRLYEITGGWVTTTADVEAKLLLDRHSHHHAWRAQQWWDRLPVLADVDRDRLCGPADARSADLVARLARLEGTVARLAGLGRVALPRLFGSYTSHRRQAGAVADGSIRRTLTIVTADLVADWHEAELVLQDRLDDPAAVQEAAEVVKALEDGLCAF